MTQKESSLVSKAELERRCREYSQRLADFNQGEKTAQYLLMQTVYRMVEDIEKNYNGSEVRKLKQFCELYYEPHKRRV